MLRTIVEQLDTYKMLLETVLIIKRFSICFYGLQAVVCLHVCTRIYESMCVCISNYFFNVKTIVVVVIVVTKNLLQVIFALVFHGKTTPHRIESKVAQYFIFVILINF